MASIEAQHVDVTCLMGALGAAVKAVFDEATD